MGNGKGEKRGGGWEEGRGVEWGGEGAESGGRTGRRLERKRGGNGAETGRRLDRKLGGEGGEGGGGAARSYAAECGEWGA